MSLKTKSACKSNLMTLLRKLNVKESTKKVIFSRRLTIFVAKQPFLPIQLMQEVKWRKKIKACFTQFFT